MQRQPEDEVMDIGEEVVAYAKADFSEVNQAFVDSMLELYRQRRPADTQAVRAVDLGTGPADIPIRLARTLALAGELAHWHIVAVDASGPMLDHAERTIDQLGLAGCIELVLADAKGTGLSAQSFDVIFSNSILHHINEPVQFWREIKRMARSGAMVFLRDLARPESPQAAQAIIDKYASAETPLLQQEFYRSLLAAYTVEEVQGQLASAGLAGLAVRMVTDRHLEVTGVLGSD